MIRLLSYLLRKIFILFVILTFSATLVDLSGTAADAASRRRRRRTRRRRTRRRRTRRRSTRRRSTRRRSTRRRSTRRRSTRRTRRSRRSTRGSTRRRSSFASRVRRAVSRVRRAVRRTTSRVRRAVRRTTSRVRRAVRRTTSRVRRTVRRTTRRMSRVTRSVKRTLNRTYNYKRESNYRKTSQKNKNAEAAKITKKDVNFVNLFSKSYDKSYSANNQFNRDNGKGLTYGGSLNAQAGLSANARGDLGRFTYIGADGKEHQVTGAMVQGGVSALVGVDGNFYANQKIGCADVFVDANGNVQVGGSLNGMATAGIVDGKAGVHGEVDAFVGARASGDVSAGVGVAGVKGTVGVGGNVGVGLGASGVVDIQIGWSGISWDVAGSAYVGVGGGISTSGNIDTSEAVQNIASKVNNAANTINNTVSKVQKQQADFNSKILSSARGLFRF